MDNRLASHTKALLICSATGLVMFVQADLFAQSERSTGLESANSSQIKSPQEKTGNTKSTLRSAVQRELYELIQVNKGKRAGNVTSKSASNDESSARVVAGSKRRNQHRIVQTGNAEELKQSSSQNVEMPTDSESPSGLPLKKSLKKYSQLFNKTSVQKFRRSYGKARPFIPPAGAKPISVAAQIDQKSDIKQTANERLFPQSQSQIELAQQQSDTLRRLESLYKRDGRQMPSMNMDDLPKNPSAGTINDGKVSAPSSNPVNRDLQKRPGASSPPSQKKGNLLQRLFGKRSKRNQKNSTKQVRPATRTHEIERNERTIQSNHQLDEPGRQHIRESNQRPRLLQDGNRRIERNSTPQNNFESEPFGSELIEEFQPQQETESEIPSLDVIPGQNAAQPNNALPVEDEKFFFPDDDPFENPTGPAAKSTRPESETFETEITPDPQRQVNRSQIETKPTISDQQQTPFDPFPVRDEEKADKQENPFTGIKLDEDESPREDSQANRQDKNDAERPESRLPSWIKSPTELEDEREDSQAIRQDENDNEQETKFETPDVFRRPIERTSATREEKMQQLLQRSGKPGLKGLCIVELRDHRELVDARPEFHASFEGKDYFFSTSESQAKFEKSPLKYAPAAGGADMILLSHNNETVAGTLDHAAWFRNRLYMFSSAESRQTFVRNPARYAEVVSDPFID